VVLLGVSAASCGVLLHGQVDLTPRRKLVYDAYRLSFYRVLSEGGMRRGR
jgi:hypothetical protein